VHKAHENLQTNVQTLQKIFAAVRSSTRSGHKYASAAPYRSCSREGKEEENMTPRTDDTARMRLATYDRNVCPQCSAWLLAPEWSEHFNERCVRHTWACDACGYGFETTVVFPAVQQAAA